MVWSRAARAMPSMRAPRITRIRRCSSPLPRRRPSSPVPSSGQPRSPSRSRSSSVGESAQQLSQHGQVLVGPDVQQVLEPRTFGLPYPVDGLATGRCEADPPPPGDRSHRLGRRSPSRSSCWTLRVTVGASTPSRSARSVILNESPPATSLWSRVAPARSILTPAVRSRRSCTWALVIARATVWRASSNSSTSGTVAPPPGTERYLLAAHKYCTPPPRRREARRGDLP